MAAARRREDVWSWKQQDTDPSLTQPMNLFLWDFYGIWEWELYVQFLGPRNISFSKGSKGRLSKAGWPLPIDIAWGSKVI